MNRVNYKKVISIVGGAIGVTILSSRIYERLGQYDKDGFDKYGFNSAGYNRDGYNRSGYDKFGYDVNGYDKNGYDKKGFDSEGFDKQGLSAEGFDRSGRDKRGYDRNGFDIDGYDHRGYDAAGYHRNGFARDGFNRNGYDWQGYGRNRYNQIGLDRAGYSKQYYANFIKQLRKRLDEAYQQMQRGEFRYAIYDARIVMEEVLRLIVQHAVGTDDIGDTILINMKICERKQLLGDDGEFLNKLHEVRHICNVNGHEFATEEIINHNKVYFVLMQIKDLLNVAENSLVCV